MARVWLLVEWVDESNVFPSYGVVNVDTVTYNEEDLIPGNFIFIRVKHDNPKRAKILRISDNKRYVKEHKEVLERQDQQVKNVLQLCMRTIKEMKSDHSFDTTTALGQQSSSHSHSSLPHVIVAKTGNSDSDDSEDDDTKPRVKPNRNSLDKTKIHTQTPKYGAQYTRKETRPKSLVRTSSNGTQRRSMITSTPQTYNPPSAVLFFDQATQTEGTYLQPPLEKILEMETVLKNLYSRFQSLVAQVNPNGTPSISDSDHNEEDVSVKSNLNGRDHQEYGQQENTLAENVNGAVEQVESVKLNKSDVNGENTKVAAAINSSALQVRRMSAQTTNIIDSTADSDMVPIGNGNAKVPARLLNDIDWNMYSSATRQLLQAVFPRKVLATHSLTGKQSPAFMNRPPKKILDPKLVEDIVITVSGRCEVPMNLVRNSITIKCTDEAKLFRNRQQYKQTRKSQNTENIPPSTISSDESANNTIS